jgi:hypothetical protein
MAVPLPKSYREKNGLSAGIATFCFSAGEQNSFMFAIVSRNLNISILHGVPEESVNVSFAAWSWRE